MTDFDLIVVGTGGLANAIVLEATRANPDLRVALVGPRARPGAASVAAGFMLNVFGEQEKGALDSSVARSKFDMLLEAKKLWPAYLETLKAAAGGDDLQINYGTFVLNNGSSSVIDDENFEYIVAQALAHKAPHQLVNPREITGLAPTESCRPLRALYLEDEGTIPSARLFRLYDAFLSRARQVEVIDGSAETLTLDGPGGHHAVSTREGRTVRGRHLVLAAGAFSQKLLEQHPDLAKRIPRLFYGTGAAMHVSINSAIPDFTFPLPDKCIRTTNRGNACGVHLVPYGPDSCYIGASNLVTRYYEPTPRIAAVHGLLQRAMDELNTNFYKANFSMIVGHRPTSADCYPLIGGTSVKGFYLASGTKREGVHMSPLIARSIVAELQGKPPVFHAAFRPERKLIYDMTREQAIQKTVLHQFSGAYQHGLKLPYSGWEPMLADTLRKSVEEVYDKLGIKSVGIPPELLNMYKHGHITYAGE